MDRLIGSRKKESQHQKQAKYQKQGAPDQQGAKDRKEKKDERKNTLQTGFIKRRPQKTPITTHLYGLHK